MNIIDMNLINMIILIENWINFWEIIISMKLYIYKMINNSRDFWMIYEIYFLILISQK